MIFKFTNYNLNIIIQHKLYIFHVFLLVNHTNNARNFFTTQEFFLIYLKNNCDNHQSHNF